MTQWYVTITEKIVGSFNRESKEILSITIIYAQYKYSCLNEEISNTKISIPFCF